MKDEDSIQAYVNAFRNTISPHVKPNIGIVTYVHPVEGPGAIVEFEFQAKAKANDSYLPISGSVADALSGIEQNAFGGDLSGITFSGTNTILQGNKAIFIKGEDAVDLWNAESAINDAQQILGKGNR